MEIEEMTGLRISKVIEETIVDRSIMSKDTEIEV